MRRSLSRLLAAGPALALALGVTPVVAGTQDFTLVNQTGVEIHAVFVSESANDQWEEDVLGQDVLSMGERVTITFSGREACLWDLMVADADGENLTWQGLNLCEISVVVLRCNEQECWAEHE